MKSTKVKTILPLLVLALLVVSAPAVSLGQVPVELEGPMSNVTNQGGGNGQITVMGIVVNIPSGTPINSPTAALTMAQLADTTPLPGPLSRAFWAARPSSWGRVWEEWSRPMMYSSSRQRTLSSVS